METLRASARTLLQGYAAIFLAEAPATGLFILAASFWNPGVGAAGLAAGVLGHLLPRAMRLPWARSPLYVCNAALSGLFLAGYRGPGWALAPYLALGAFLAVMLVAVLMDLFWRWDHLPVLSLPFILATWALMTVLGPGPLGEPPLLGLEAAIPLALRGFLATLGSIICTPHPLPGLFILVGLALNSRLLALFAAAGFLLGGLVDRFLGTESTWTSFNQVLVALALGGVFLVPSAAGLVALGAGLLLAALGTALAGRFLGASGLPVLALPFVGATLLVLSLLRRRISFQAPHLTLEHPALPEINIERARLARARGVDAESVPLSAPFFGEWQVYQGFDGSHTHREAWRFALDFFIQDRGGSFRGAGGALEDYHCFGLPVRAPCAGVLVDGRDDLPDNPPGEVDAEHNWGNFGLLRMPSGLFVLLAHLRQGSLKVAIGAEVAAGDTLAACGSSGRSPQPHLHMHVQTETRLGSATRPFHLAGVLCRVPGHEGREFNLHVRPGEGWSVGPGSDGPGLARAFQFPAQRVLDYRVQGPGRSGPQDRRMSVEQDLEGVFRLRSDRGASTAFQRTEVAFGCYDRQGGRDDFFDLWILAAGFTPLASLVADWQDAPSARLLPAPLWRRVLAALSFADLVGLRTRYRRRQLAHGLLKQTGLHRSPVWGLLPAAVTEARISPELGLTHLLARVGDRRWSARLLSSGMAEGTPGLLIPHTSKETLP